MALMVVAADAVPVLAQLFDNVGISAGGVARARTAAACGGEGGRPLVVLAEAVDEAAALRLRPDGVSVRYIQRPVAWLRKYAPRPDVSRPSNWRDNRPLIQIGRAEPSTTCSGLEKKARASAMAPMMTAKSS